MKSPHHILTAALATGAAILAAPALASAQDFCVNGAPGCTGTPVAAKDLASTLKAAESNGTDDRFFLANGTYTNPALGYQSLEQVDIIGASRTGTVLVGSGSDVAVALGGNSGSSLSRLTIRPGASSTALTLTGTGAHNVDVKADATNTTVSTGLILSGARRSPTARSICRRPLSAPASRAAAATWCIRMSSLPTASASWASAAPAR